MPLSGFLDGATLSGSMVALLAVLAIASFDLSARARGRRTHLLFACVLGSVLSFGLIRLTHVFLQPGVRDNGYAMALGILLLFLCWRSLFGPWEAQTKAAVLGTFVFWVTYHLLSREAPAQRSLHLMAMGAALLPAAVWCALFLKYHRERLSNVFLMFFAGMLSTVPILFYDTLVRKGVELQFFLFRVTPESFSQTSHGFVSGHLAASGGTRTALLAGLLSFVIVGVIEEASKYWVVTRSGRRLFTSIDDVLELSIIAAIGFAFAENIVNPVYFTGFIREYLLEPARPDIMGFFSNFLGRSVLTSMVHILATGVMGYFLGLALFAGPYLKEMHAKGRTHRILEPLHRLLRIKEEALFRTNMLLIGLLAAIVIHGAFNFMVTLPEMLPGHPRTFGDMFPSLGVPFVAHLPLLLVPSMLYVVGGFWLLTSLFLRKENLEERGHLVPVEVVVKADDEEIG